MPKTIDLLLKELKLPAFMRHYLGNCSCIALPPASRQSNAIKNRLLSKVMVMFVIYRDFVSKKWRIVIRNACNVGREKRAYLPGKSFANLNLAELSAPVQQQAIALKDQADWAHHAGNVLAVGPSGVGKSHITAAHANQLIEREVRVKWFSATALVQSLQKAKRNLDLMTAMTRLDKYQVLVIDDIGYVKKNDAETQVLFEYIAHRYESGSLIITSNQPFSQWDQIFPDTMMTVAAIDRIIHHATIIEIEGESYRKKQSLKK